MTSWAAIAKAAVQPTATSQDLTAKTEGLRLLVVDANAIIAGIRLEGVADRAVTIQEVFNEIRDKQSRQFLATLPYQLQISEPTEESVKIGKCAGVPVFPTARVIVCSNATAARPVTSGKGGLAVVLTAASAALIWNHVAHAVTRFARETGDVSTLSANDVKLLALAHTLEVTAHGAAHLAAHAAQVSISQLLYSLFVPILAASNYISTQRRHATIRAAGAMQLAVHASLSSLCAATFVVVVATSRTAYNSCLTSEASFSLRCAVLDVCWTVSFFSSRRDCHTIVLGLIVVLQQGSYCTLCKKFCELTNNTCYGC